MSPSYVLSLSPYARLVEPEPGRFAFQVKEAVVEIPRPDAALLEALRLLAGPGGLESELYSRVESSDDFETILKLDYCLEALLGQGWLCHGVVTKDSTLATCVPIQKDHRLGETGIPAEARWLLSRFACLRRVDAVLVIESPLARAQIRLDDPRAVSVLAALAGPATWPEVAARVPELEPGTIRLFLGLLRGAGFLTTAPAGGVPAEDEDAALRQWEFHDLFFHSRSREGRHANPYGAAYRFRGATERPPALKPPRGGSRLVLPRADLDSLLHNDLTLTAALEARCSRRAHGPGLITLRQLGEFLDRTARVRAMMTSPDGAWTKRVSPGGGGCHELELYVVVNRCDGLESGLYHYRPLEHELETLAGRTAEVDWLLANAGHTAHADPPQVLIEIAARFGRVSWKYASMTYATILKDVGCLFQTMYLAATALGLAPCALGGGHSDMFARAAGLEYYEETSVGEFILGGN